MDACALRFNGYHYAEDHGIDLGNLINSRVPSNRWNDLSVHDQLAAFFMVQRALRWHSPVPADDPLYRAFRTLFLRLHREEIPERYRMRHGEIVSDDPRWDWDGWPQAERDEWVARVRSAHAATLYDEPDFGRS